MKKLSNKFKMFLTVASLVVSFAGIGIGIGINSNKDLENNTTVEVEDGKVETLKVEVLDFYPGKKVDYTIKFNNGSAENYYATIDFHNCDDGNLKDYIDVKISDNNNDLFFMKLNEILNEEKLSLGKNIEYISIEYSMPEDVGNEAQGTSVTFFVDIEISNEEN